MIETKQKTNKEKFELFWYWCESKLPESKMPEKNVRLFKKWLYRAWLAGINETIKIKKDTGEFVVDEMCYKDARENSWQ